MKKIFLYLYLISACAIAQPEFPVVKNYANDFTSTLSQSELYTLNASLKSFDDSTSSQVVFIMISSLNGYPLELYTYEVASKNKIGSAKNNGVLFLVSKDDREMRIEVGYGLEGALPDALASSILRNEVRPHFKHGEYYTGVASGLSAILNAIQGEYKSEKKEDEEGIGFPIMYIILVIIFLIFSGRKGGRGGGLLPLLILSSMGTGSRRSGWGGGGFGGFSGGGGGFSGGGGGFGGFSGGGGSFGGGGASGSW
ncbi:MAG: TPM domain-containing protein [Bacteroidota bacterium]